MNRVIHFEFHAADTAKMAIPGIAWLAYCKDIEEIILVFMKTTKTPNNFS